MARTSKKAANGGLLAIEKIVIDNSFQPRQALDNPTIQNYAENFDAMPPVTVRRGDYVLIDGRHRYEAALSIGRTEIPYQYAQDSDTEFGYFDQAVKANIKHGLPYKPEERTAVADAYYRHHHPYGLDAWTPEKIVAECGAGSVRTIGRWINRDKHLLETGKLVAGIEYDDDGMPQIGTQRLKTDGTYAPFEPINAIPLQPVTDAFEPDDEDEPKEEKDEARERAIHFQETVAKPAKKALQRLFRAGDPVDIANDILMGDVSEWVDLCAFALPFFETMGNRLFERRAGTNRPLVEEVAEVVGIIGQVEEEATA